MSEPPDWVPPVRTCALCHAVTSGDDPDFPSPSDSPTFAPHEGAAVHGACLAAWPERDAALRSFFPGRRRSWRSQPHWITVHEGTNLAALVGGDATPVEVRVVLARALHEWTIPVREWRERVHSDEVPSWWLPFEREAWVDARPALATAVPGIQTLLERTAWKSRARVWEIHARQEREARAIEARQWAERAQVRLVELAQQAIALPSVREHLAAGTLPCPRCGVVGPHRLREERPPAYLVCAACHRSFEPT